jgi:hypothetical protein
MPLYVHVNASMLVGVGTSEPPGPGTLVKISASVVMVVEPTVVDTLPTILTIGATCTLAVPIMLYGNVKTVVEAAPNTQGAHDAMAAGTLYSVSSHHTHAGGDKAYRRLWCYCNTQSADGESTGTGRAEWEWEKTAPSK